MTLPLDCSVSTSSFPRFSRFFAELRAAFLTPVFLSVWLPCAVSFVGFPHRILPVIPAALRAWLVATFCAALLLRYVPPVCAASFTLAYPANHEQMVRGNSIIVIEALERASK